MWGLGGGGELMVFWKKIILIEIYVLKLLKNMF